MITTTIPDRTEAAEYDFTYINQVPAGDICDILEAQLSEVVVLLRGVSEDRSLGRYAPDKWTIRQVVNHVNDAERLFVFRALWFARGFDSPLPSFDQGVAVSAARADERPLSSHVEEFTAIRSASVAFFRQSVPPTHGHVAASRAGFRSACTRLPSSRQAMRATMRGFWMNGISELETGALAVFRSCTSPARAREIPAYRRR